MKEGKWLYCCNITFSSVVGLALGLLPLVDNFAHFFGFLAGLLLGSALLIQNCGRALCGVEPRDEARTWYEYTGLILGAQTWFGAWFGGLVRSTSYMLRGARVRKALRLVFYNRTSEITSPFFLHFVTAGILRRLLSPPSPLSSAGSRLRSSSSTRKETPATGAKCATTSRVWRRPTGHVRLRSARYNPLFQLEPESRLRLKSKCAS